jgi:TRAP-type C4-dicarboxylate transport system permease small subunit
MQETESVPDEEQWRSGSSLSTAVHLISGGTAGFLLFCLMLITIIDVAGRYIFNAPLPGGSEIIQLIMAGIIYSALPSVNRQEGHITVDLLDAVTPEPVVRVRQILVSLILLVLLGTITWCLWLLAESLRQDGETWEYLKFQRSPIVYFMCLCSAIGTFIILLNLLRYLLGARRPEPGFI